MTISSLNKLQVQNKAVYKTAASQPKKTLPKKNAGFQSNPKTLEEIRFVQRTFGNQKSSRVLESLLTPIQKRTENKRITRKPENNPKQKEPDSSKEVLDTEPFVDPYKPSKLQRIIRDFNIFAETGNFGKVSQETRDDIARSLKIYIKEHQENILKGANKIPKSLPAKEAPLKEPGGLEIPITKNIEVYRATDSEGKVFGGVKSIYENTTLYLHIRTSRKEKPEGGMFIKSKIGGFDGRVRLDISNKGEISNIGFSLTFDY